MDRAKGSTSGSAVGDVPVDPLVEILSRVPAKSVCRFKCVSKAWLDLITDPHHRKKLAQAMQGLFCHKSKKSEDDQSYSFSFIDLAARSVPLDIDPSFSFLTELPGIRFLYLRDSCNGLVLFEHHEGSEDSTRLGYIVCNPTTKEWKVVPACGSPTSLTFPYLAFDPAVSSHFNLVQFQVEEDEKILSVYGYSSETGAWCENQIDEQGEEGQLEGWRRFNFLLGNPPRCPFVNGFLHLIVLDKDQMKIVALDVQGKARRMIPVPDVADSRRWMCYFGESQGQLHYMTQESLDAHKRKYKLSIWVLQDYCAQEWVLKGTMNTNEVFGENSDTGVTEGFEVVECVEVVDIHQHCNVVFFTHFWVDQNRSVDFFTHFLKRKLVAYDLDSKEYNVYLFILEDCIA
ncbi:unnamed protein product [Urochloa decumbens]|uniref:F-box domain-containing protein n=1 Tax=Urochloa decumbens TaxID=240449 RepID=A0ABC9G8J3_9POAL